MSGTENSVVDAMAMIKLIASHWQGKQILLDVMQDTSEVMIFVNDKFDVTLNKLHASGVDMKNVMDVVVPNIIERCVDFLKDHHNWVFEDLDFNYSDAGFFSLCKYSEKIKEFISSNLDPLAKSRRSYIATKNNTEKYYVEATEKLFSRVQWKMGTYERMEMADLINDIQEIPFFRMRDLSKKHKLISCLLTKLVYTDTAEEELILSQLKEG
jgi:hypothetical protein